MHVLRSVLRLSPLCFCTAAFAAASLDTEREASRSPKGPLPDPALLDGSAQQAEKRQDYGMLGQFDIPGDDKSTAKDGSVGPQSSPNGGGTAAPDDKNTQAGGGAAATPGQEQDKNSQGGGGSQSADQKKDGQGGGGGGAQAASSPKTGGGGGDAQGGSGSQGGAAAGGSSGGKAPSQGTAAAGAQGIQVGQLLGDGQGTAQGQQGAQTGGGTNKPQQIALGDKAMQISQTAPTPGVIGSQVADPMTRPADAKMGTGTGGGPGGDNTNRGSEKGRTMPKGL